MSNLPIVGGSSNTWGTELNNFLTVSHEPSGGSGGKLNASALSGVAFTGTVNLPASSSIGTVLPAEILNLSGTTSSIQIQLNALAPKASPSFTGTVNLPASSSIGTVLPAEILNLSGTTSSIQTQLNTKAPTVSPTFTGTVNLPASSSIGTVLPAEILNLSGTTSSIQTQLNTKAPTVSPTFTGTVNGITKAMVGLSNVDNTADSTKNVLYASSAGIATPAAHTHPLSSGAIDVTAMASEINQVVTGAGISVTASTLTNLTSGGYDASSYHYHASDRNRTNHTGTQSPSTISPQGSGSGLNSDKLRGKALVVIATGNTTVTANSSGSIGLLTAGHNHYTYSVYTSGGVSIDQTGAAYNPTTTTFLSDVYVFIEKQTIGGTDNLLIYNNTVSSVTVYYEVMAWQSV